MKPKKYIIILLLVLTSLFICSCRQTWPSSYFKKELDKQFGEGTYTFELTDDMDRPGWWVEAYRVTLNDYPNTPFYVGLRPSDCDEMECHSSYPDTDTDLIDTFGPLIYDEYAKDAVNDPSLYDTCWEINYFAFYVKREMSLSEAENIYDEAMKIVAIINREYPFFNNGSYRIIVKIPFIDENYPNKYDFTIASSDNGILTVEPKQEYFNYFYEYLDETKISSDE